MFFLKELLGCFFMDSISQSFGHIFSFKWIGILYVTKDCPIRFNVFLVHDVYVSSGDLYISDITNEQFVAVLSCYWGSADTSFDTFDTTVTIPNVLLLSTSDPLWYSIWKKLISAFLSSHQTLHFDCVYDWFILTVQSHV